MKNSIFRKKTQRSIHIIKITQFGLVSTEKSKSKMRGRKSFMTREKIVNLIKINLIQASESKLILNDKILGGKHKI